MNTRSRFARCCPPIRGLALSIWLATGAATAQVAEISECVINKVNSSEVLGAEVQSDVYQALECLDYQPARLMNFASYAQRDSRSNLCHSYEELSQSCRNWLASSGKKPAPFMALTQIMHSCIPKLSSLDLKLQRSGISSDILFGAALTTGAALAKKCALGEEHGEVKPSKSWNFMCNDYEEGSTSFWTLNDSYYDHCKSAEGEVCNRQEASLRRAKLLRGFAKTTPLRVAWQRTVASMMAIDSLTSGATAEERSGAARALGVHGDYSASSLYTLLHALEDEDPTVKADAALALRTQGNKSPLVVYSLISLLHKERVTPSMKMNVALALREQANPNECVQANFDSFGLNDSWKKNDIGEAIPACATVNQESKSNSADEGGAYVKITNLGQTVADACRIADMDPNASLFDQMTDPDQLADFDIAKNLCYLEKKVGGSKIERMARMSLALMLNDADDEVVIRVLVALRKLAEPMNGDASIINTIRSVHLRHANFRIRRAAVFALAEAAKSQMWLVTELASQLGSDTSPSVRRAIIASLASLMPMTTKAGNSLFMHYAHGVAEANKFAKPCEQDDYSAAFDRALDTLKEADFTMYVAGLDEAIARRKELECADSAGKGWLLSSSPSMGQSDVPTTTSISFTIAGQVTAEVIKKYVEVVYKNQLLAYDIESITADFGSNFIKSLVTLKLQAPLLSGQMYKVLFLEGFSWDVGQALQKDRPFLFQTTSTGVADRIFDLMENDPSLDVRFAAAEAFVVSQPKAVFHFLRRGLFDANPEISERAGTFLNAGLLSWDFVSDLSAGDQDSFWKNLFRDMMKYIDAHERDLHHKDEGPAEIKDLRYIAALSQQYSLMLRIFELRAMPQNVRASLVTEFNLTDWIFARTIKDFPRTLPYTRYEKIYYSGLRTTILEMLDQHLIDKQKLKSSKYKIYADQPLMDEK